MYRRHPPDSRSDTRAADPRSDADHARVPASRRAPPVAVSAAMAVVPVVAMYAVANPAMAAMVAVVAAVTVAWRGRPGGE